MNAPAWQRIHDHLLAGIRSGLWREGDRLPSEAELCAQFGVARMTVSRALRELASAQIVSRVQGAGSFVAPSRHQTTLVEIRNIADEIAARRHRHSAQVLLLESVAANAPMAALMEIAAGTPLFHSRIVHRQDGIPLQLEERWVNASLAPDYLQQDFTRRTPNAYLTAVAPLERAAYSIEARQPDRETRRLLAMDDHDPCLLLLRRTWSRGQVVSAAQLWHPGSRHQFTGAC